MGGKWGKGEGSGDKGEGSGEKGEGSGGKGGSGECLPPCPPLLCKRYFSYLLPFFGWFVSLVLL